MRRTVRSTITLLTFLGGLAILVLLARATHGAPVVSKDREETLARGGFSPSQIVESTRPGDVVGTNDGRWFIVVEKDTGEKKVKMTLIKEERAFKDKIGNVVITTIHEVYSPGWCKVTLEYFDVVDHSACVPDFRSGQD